MRFRKGVERTLRVQKRPTVGADGAHGQFDWSAVFGDFAFMRLILTRPRVGRNPKIRRMAVGGELIKNCSKLDIFNTFAYFSNYYEN